MRRPISIDNAERRALERMYKRGRLRSGRAGSTIPTPDIGFPSPGPLARTSLPAPLSSITFLFTDRKESAR